LSKGGAGAGQNQGRGENKMGHGTASQWNLLLESD
jgi:hypothetical protein